MPQHAPGAPPRGRVLGAVLVLLVAGTVAVAVSTSGIVSSAAVGLTALVCVAALIFSARRRSGELLEPATLVVLGLVAALTFAGIMASRTEEPSGQVFALYGQTKRIVLPVVLVLFGCIAIAISMRSRVRRPPPWWWLLLGVFVLSTAASLIAPRQPLDLLDAAQGAALLAGALLLSWTGMQCAQWQPRTRSALMAVLILAAAAGVLLPNGLTPFDSLLVPATFAAVLLATTGTRRLLYTCLATGLGAMTVVQLVFLGDTTAGGLSLAVAGEVVGCAALLVVAWLPRTARRPVLVAGVLLGGYGLVTSGVGDLLVGRWQSFSDVTLAHRGYETAQVLHLLAASPLSLVFGLGPAGTVDLSASPDAGTLAAAGRVLTAVDDVHLLSSWLLLKLGVLGLIWVTVFAIACSRLVAVVLRDPQRRWDQALLMFTVAGLVSSLPAATNLFTNPLPFLFLGIVLGRSDSSTPAADLTRPGYTTTRLPAPGGALVANAPKEQPWT